MPKRKIIKLSERFINRIEVDTTKPKDKWDIKITKEEKLVKKIFDSIKDVIKRNVKINVTRYNRTFTIEIFIFNERIYEFDITI